MAELGLKSKSPGSRPIFFSSCWLAAEMPFSRIPQNSDLWRRPWIYQTKPCHPKGFSVLQGGNLWEVPNSSISKVIALGCVWWFPGQQRTMVMKSSGPEARLPEFQPVQVPHSPAVFLGQVAFLSLLLWYLPPLGCCKAPNMYNVLRTVWNKCQLFIITCFLRLHLPTKHSQILRV